MSYFTAGFYRKSAPLTLRQYADSTKAFLSLLQKMHSIFNNLEWVGRRPNATIKVQADLQNLDDLIFEYAGGNSQVYDVANADGMPTWDSIGWLGYIMIFNSGRSPAAGGVSVSIVAGSKEKNSLDSVTISFPLPGTPDFPHREFYQYNFIKNLFLESIRFWQADDGLVFSHGFADIVSDDGAPVVGWLTYIRNEQAFALRNDPQLRDLQIEPVEPHGVLITLDKKIISPDNLDQIENARTLRHLLLQEKLIAV